MAGHRRAEAMPSFGRLCPAMTERESLSGGYTQPVPIASPLRSQPQILVALPGRPKLAVISGMGTRSREVIWSSRISGAKMSAEHAREEARKAAREADRAEAYAWSVRMEGYGGPAHPSPTSGQGPNDGVGRATPKKPGGKQPARLPG